MPTLSEFQIRQPYIFADKSAGKYWLYGTNGLGGVKEAPLGFMVRQSRDLINWSEPQSVLSRITGPQEADFYRSPEVHFHQGRWYLLGNFGHGVSMLKPQSSYIRIFSAGSPAGPFIAHSKGAVTPLGWLGSGGTLHVDPDGRPWLVFSRSWLQTRDGEVHAIPLSADLRRPVGEAKLLFRSSEAKWSQSQDSEFGVGYHVADGPWLHRTRSGDLLLLWSSFRLGSYVTGLARSASDEITGPWIQADEPFYPHDGGSAMTFRDFEDRDFLVLHAPNIVGKERARLRLLQEIESELALA